MPTRAPDLLRLAALAALLGACPPAALLRTAEPTPAGQWRLGAGAAGGAIADRETGGRSGTGQVELNLRRGVSPNADVGARLYTLGLGLDATLRFVHRGAWSVALAPELSALRTPSSGLTTDALHVFGRVALPCHVAVRVGAVGVDRGAHPGRGRLPARGGGLAGRVVAGARGQRRGARQRPELARARAERLPGERGRGADAGRRRVRRDGHTLEPVTAA